MHLTPFFRILISQVNVFIYGSNEKRNTNINCFQRLISDTCPGIKLTSLVLEIECHQQVNALIRHFVHSMCTSRNNGTRT
jgi:hypothetical protein